MFYSAGTVENQVPTFAITDTNFYVPVVILSIQNNVKLLQQLKSGFEKTTYWNKYQSKVSIGQSNQYLDYLIDPIFQVANRLFVSSFENSDHQTSCKRCFLPTVKIKDYNVMIDGQNFFN